MNDSSHVKLISLLEGIKIKDPSPQLPKKILHVVQEAQSIAKLGTTLGTVSICRKNSPEQVMAQIGELLNPGDKLSTGEGGRTFLIFKDGTQLWLNEKTELLIPEKPNRIQLAAGELLAFVRKRRFREDHFILQTPAGRVEVLGTEFVTTIQPDNSSCLTVLTGKVTFQNQYGSTYLKKNEQSIAKPHIKPTIPVQVDTNSLISWTGDLVKHTLNRRVSIPERLLSKTRSSPDKPWNWVWIISVCLLALIIGYLLGYCYGNFQYF